MKKEFAVNPDLTSMPLTYLGRIPQELIAMGMWTEIGAPPSLEQTESHPHFVSCSVLSFSFIVCFVSSLFQIDTNKSITQKRLKKVSNLSPSCLSKGFFFFFFANGHLAVGMASSMLTPWRCLTL